VNSPSATLTPVGGVSGVSGANVLLHAVGGSELEAIDNRALERLRRNQRPAEQTRAQFGEDG